MAPLQKIIEEFCFQQKPQFDVASCRLYHQKKLLDPTTPVRFANLPKEAKLELVTGIILGWHMYAPCSFNGCMENRCMEKAAVNIYLVHTMAWKFL